MTRKITKKSSKRMFLLYAVIWGLFTPVFTTGASYLLAEEPPAQSIDQVVRSLDDPFDVKVRAPEIVELFLEGLAEIKRQKEIQEKPPEAPVVAPVVPVVVEPTVAPVIKEPVKPKKVEIPALKVTGIVYDTDRPQAIINGKVVGVGSNLNGVMILKIQKGRIDARYEGSDITLKFNNE